jgi:hypothetical protein
VLDLEGPKIESSYYLEGEMGVGVHEASVDNDGNIIYKVLEWK